MIASVNASAKAAPTGGSPRRFRRSQSAGLATGRSLLRAYVATRMLRTSSARTLRECARPPGRSAVEILRVGGSYSAGSGRPTVPKRYTAARLSESQRSAEEESPCSCRPPNAPPLFPVSPHSVGHVHLRRQRGAEHQSGRLSDPSGASNIETFETQRGPSVSRP